MNYILVEKNVLDQLVRLTQQLEYSSVKCVSISEAARQLKVDRRTIYNKIERGHLATIPGSMVAESDVGRKEVTYILEPSLRAEIKRCEGITKRGPKRKQNQQALNHP